MYIPSQIVLPFLNFLSWASKPPVPANKTGYRAGSTAKVSPEPGLCPVVEGENPTVKLDNVTVTGITCQINEVIFPNGGKYHKFLNIPFAEPASGVEGRFRLPRKKTYTQDIDGTKWGPTCIQQRVAPPETLPCPVAKIIEDLHIFPDEKDPIPADEDCLTVNVVTPDDATPESKLPVVVWIFGGAFQVGAPNIYPGESIVAQGRMWGMPSIYVSLNHRVSGWGFLASKEVEDAGVGNLGIHDQRLALRWVQKYIRGFGGDPSRVTIWGVSSGAFSVGLQMVANGGDHENLFSAAYMQSGGLIPVGPLSKGQERYDQIVKHAQCSDAPDTLECLRTAPIELLREAFDSTPPIFSENAARLSWLPRIDGVLFEEDYMTLVEKGKIANVPFIAGAVDDEATFFSLGMPEVRSDEQFKEWIHDVLLPGISYEEVDQIARYYENTLSAGSPFNTGDRNALTPQFKRASAFQGDALFHGSRRHLLEHRAGSQPAYTYLSKWGKGNAFLGAFHGSDLGMIYLPGQLSYPMARFVATGDPGWERYDLAKKNMFGIDEDGNLTNYTDTYREKEVAYAFNVVKNHPF